jgi:RNA polymerase sigma-70 factor (ECF subfamily)
MKPDINALIKECRNGNLEAFGHLLDAYQGPVFNVVYRMVNDRDDAEDITQSAFVKAYENLGRFDPRYKFFSWIYRIAINEALNFLKSRERLQPLEGDLESAWRGPEDALRSAEIGAGVQEALMRLKPTHRAAIVLKHLRGCSYQEVAAILHMPEKTVKSTLFSARRLLRDALLASGMMKP